LHSRITKVGVISVILPVINSYISIAVGLNLGLSRINEKTIFYDSVML
jgi:hypothetical protein